MERMLPILTLAVSGALVVSTAVYAAQTGHPPTAFREVALVGPSLGFGTADSQRDVIQPPSSVDPGMAIDPPETGAKMPVIRPQPAPGGKLILPR
jgi:hypothetical protein